MVDCLEYTAMAFPEIVGHIVGVSAAVVEEVSELLWWSGHARAAILARYERRKDHGMSEEATKVVG